MVDPDRVLEFGFFPVPYAAAHADLLRQVQLAERLGLDLIGIQDHPYQRRYLDTFALMAWLAARTERIRLFPDVAHLPLRPPAMLAKEVASLDVLSGGRIELGLGAGGFAQASQAMGGVARTPGEALAALDEAITILREFWSTPQRGIRFDGEHYQLTGVKAGPAPAHDIGIWIGGGGPRMLRLIARQADGWIPPAPRDLGREELLAKQVALDRAAADAGRDPATIRRVLNLGGTISDGPAVDWLNGPTEHWVEELTALAAEGFDTFVIWPDQDPDEQLHAFAEVATAVRVAAARR